MGSHRRPICFNDDARSWLSDTESRSDTNSAFQKATNGFRQTPLVMLESVTKGLGVKAVYVKDETKRLAEFSQQSLQEAEADSRHGNNTPVKDSGIEHNAGLDVPSTIMREIEEQLRGQPIDLLVSPVRTGEIARATLRHFKRKQDSPALLTVESDMACSLWKFMSGNDYAGDHRTATIMKSSNTTPISSAGLAYLKLGTDASLTVSDYEAHEACLSMQKAGIECSPYGAAGLAALNRLEPADKDRLQLTADSVIIILCTDGGVQYDIPRDVRLDDVTSLTQTLVQIDSSNPEFGSNPGPGETSLGEFITAWFEHRDIESHWIEPHPGRPSVLGVVRGTGGGKCLMFNGHMDTVSLQSYEGDGLSGHIKDGNIYGRGAADMKSGLAAAMVALARAKGMQLRGDVILAAVSDEEADSIGTEDILKAGWRADAAIVPEPTEEVIINTHKGLANFEVDIHGVAAHGSRSELGIDAICKAGYFLVELDRHAQRLQNRFQSNELPETGAPSIHAGVIQGGQEINSYPSLCTLSIERRTVPGETLDMLQGELLNILDDLTRTVPNFRFSLRNTLYRPSFFISREHPFLLLVAKEAAQIWGQPLKITGERYWTDMALLDEAGIPGVIWGPKGYGLHAKEEWVEVKSILRLTEALTRIMKEFCK